MRNVAQQNVLLLNGAESRKKLYKIAWHKSLEKKEGQASREYKRKNNTGGGNVDPGRGNGLKKKRNIGKTLDGANVGFLRSNNGGDGETRREKLGGGANPKCIERWTSFGSWVKKK